MKATTWRTLAIIFFVLFVIETGLAIIFFVLFVIETGFMIWVYKITIDEQENTFECLYNICSYNYDATYVNGVCTCYDLDILGDYIVTKTKYMK